MKRLVLRFRENEFNVAVQKYGNRTRIEREIKKELKKLLPNYKVTDPFFKNCKKNFYKELGKAYPKHLELMKVEKIPFMIDLDTDQLFKLINEYETKPSANELAPKEVKSPSINQFEDVAETQEEIDKFEAVMKVLKVIEEAESVLNIEVYLSLIHI